MLDPISDWVLLGIVSSLKLTANAPENRVSQKETIVFQPSIFRCYVSFREGKLPNFFAPKNDDRGFTKKKSRKLELQGDRTRPSQHKYRPLEEFEGRRSVSP